MACGQGQKHILEIYTLEISDIQGFIERKQHIFNFYLMDPWMDLPDPKEILLEEDASTGRQSSQQGQQQQQQQQHALATAEEARTFTTAANNDNQSKTSVDLSINQHQVEVAFPNNDKKQNNFFPAEEEEEDPMIENEENDAMAHRQAQQLVDDMFSAVKSIGRTRRQKGGASDKGSIAAQIASKLKQFKETKNKTEVMQEGVKVIRQVSQAVVKKTKDIKTVMPKIPNRREPDIAPVYARVGRVIIQDARVFTRTVATPDGDKGASPQPTADMTSGTINDSSNGKPPTIPTTKRGGGQQSQQQKHHQVSTGMGGTGSTATAMSSHGLGSKWNKPIAVSEIVLRPSELCPPSTLLDDNGLPAVFQPLDKIVDVVMKRALVALAKSNTTRFLQTAMGELLEMEYSTIFGGDSGGNQSSVQQSSAPGRPYQRSGTAPEPRRGANSS